MNSQNHMRFSSDEIIAILFSQTRDAQPGIFSRMFSVFGYHAKPAQVAPYPIPLATATAVLVQKGMNQHEAQNLQNAVISIMADRLPDVYLTSAMQRDDFTGTVTMNDMHWSPRHFLGVEIRDPKIDLSEDQTFIKAMKAEIKTVLDDHIRGNPTVFMRTSLLTGELQPVAQLS